MEKPIGMQMVECLNNLEEKLLDRVLFLAFENLLNCGAEPFHDHNRGIIGWKDIQDLRDVFSSQDSQDIMLAHKASREANPTWSLESLDGDKFLGHLVPRLVHLAIGAFCDSFQKGILISHFAVLHADYYQAIIIIYKDSLLDEKWDEKNASLIFITFKNNRNNYNHYYFKGLFSSYSPSDQLCETPLAYDNEDSCP